MINKEVRHNPTNNAILKALDLNIDTNDFKVLTSPQKQKSCH